MFSDWRILAFIKSWFKKSSYKREIGMATMSDMADLAEFHLDETPDTTMPNLNDALLKVYEQNGWDAKEARLVAIQDKDNGKVSLYSVGNQEVEANELAHTGANRLNGVWSASGGVSDTYPDVGANGDMTGLRFRNPMSPADTMEQIGAASISMDTLASYGAYQSISG